MPAPKSVTARNRLPSRSARWRPIWLAAALCVVTIATFWPTLSARFTSWDDEAFIVHNPRVTQFSLANLGYQWTHPLQTIYVPLTMDIWCCLSQVAPADTPASDGSLLNPTVYHATNVLAHCVAAVLVFLLLRQLLGDDLPAAAGAMLFAIHPLQVEAVAWTSGLKDVLSGALLFGAVLAYLTAAARRSAVTRCYVLGVGLFIAAMLAKPSAMTGVGLIVIVDWLLLRRPWRTVLAWSLPWGVFAVACAVVARLVQPITTIADAGPIWARPLLAGQALAFYAWKLVWPATLGIDYGQYPIAVMKSVAFKIAWVVPTVLLAITALICLRRRASAQAAIPLAGLLIFIAAPFHTLGWVAFDFQQYSTVADHYLYVAMLGVALVGGWAIQRCPPTIAAVVVVALAVALGARSFVQAQTWRDSPTLFTHALAVNPNSWAAETSLATTALDQNDLQEAMRRSARAIQLNSANALPYVVQGSVMARVGDLTRATAAYRAAAERGPTHAGILANLGGILAQQGQFAEAAQWLDRSVEIDEDQPAAQLNLGTMLFQQNRPADAEPHLRRAAQLSPTDPQAHANLGFALLALNQRQEAIAELQQAARLNCPNPAVRQTLAELGVASP